LQSLVVFDHDPTETKIKNLKEDWGKIFKNQSSKERFIQRLQREADFLGHHIDVSEVVSNILARAQA
jgi:hypothetical protein